MTEGSGLLEEMSQRDGRQAETSDEHDCQQDAESYSGSTQGKAVVHLPRVLNAEDEQENHHGHPRKAHLKNAEGQQAGEHGLGDHVAAQVKQGMRDMASIQLPDG